MEMEMISKEKRREIMEREFDRIGFIPPTPPPSPSPNSSISHHDIQAGFEHQKVTKEKNCNIISSQLEELLMEKCLKKLDHNIQQLKEENDNNKIQPSSNIVQKPRFFTSKRLHSSIIASETTRIFCALIIAFLVVLSYVDYPLFGRNIVRAESVIASRPLYILLLTDATIVFARLYLENRGGDLGDSSLEEEEMPQVQDDHGHNWIQAVKFLERGLVVYQAIRGIFIDFSVYAVIVICGLSFV
ncbi:uncharacterized protein LOC133795125 [Humulus lupulus]|uniref:uncharacterized protein LOC133795125 n=1 Tax=Humulus lupulus TaxID=3486 RepID=UPI002B4175F6|nr:uncharacterized protein LOC133795125 [Humulus lupulus]